MSPQRAVAVMAFAAILAPALAAAQVNFPKSGYYAGLGDSVAAGEGALPVTSGYVYDLYDRGVFGKKQEMVFSNAAVRGARSWELRIHQVSQVLCVKTAQRPTVVTITVGANDIFAGDPDIASIAARVVDSVNVLLNNNRGSVLSPVLDPETLSPCPALDNVTILVSNYYSIPHPVPGVFALLDDRPARIRSSTATRAPVCSSAAGIESGSRRPLYTFSGTTGAGHDRTEVGFSRAFQFRRSPDKRRSRLHRETVRGGMAERELSDPVRHRGVSPSPSVPSLSCPR